MSAAGRIAATVISPSARGRHGVGRGIRRLQCGERVLWFVDVRHERNAVFQMVASGQQRIKLIVIYTPTQEPAAPCGACRQVINEFGPLASVVSLCDSNQRLDSSINDLLPDSFGPQNLGES